MTDFSYADYLNWLNSQPEPSYGRVRTVINPTTIKYQIKKPDGNLLTFAEFLGLLESKDKSFINDGLHSLLGGEDGIWSSAYFWECIPVSKATINKPFEFVKIKSTALNTMTQDWSRFQEHINRSSSLEVTSFSNLRKNATLVIPMPKRGHQLNCTERDNNIRDYKNLRMFDVEADLEQRRSFWQEAGKKMLESLEESNAPKWLSTHGLGVPYLHIRIDSIPKYYSWSEYKKEVIEEPERESTPSPILPEQPKRKNEEVDSSSEDELNKKRKVEEKNNEVSPEPRGPKGSQSLSSPNVIQQDSVNKGKEPKKEDRNVTLSKKESKLNKDLEKLQKQKRTKASRKLLSFKNGNLSKDAEKWFDELIEIASENNYQVLKEVCGEEISTEKREKIIAELKEIKSKKDSKNNSYLEEIEAKNGARQILQKVVEDVDFEEKIDEVTNKLQEVIDNPQSSAEETKNVAQELINCLNKRAKKEGKSKQLEQLEQLGTSQKVSQQVKQVVNKLRQHQAQAEQISVHSIPNSNKEANSSSIWIVAGILGIGAVGTLTYWIVKRRMKGNK